MGKQYTVAAFGDVHVPYHDKEALGIALKEAAEEIKGQPNPVFMFIGDLLDCESLSSYRKSPDRHSLWLEELKDSRPVLVAIDGVAKSVGARVVWTLGNHEQRLQRMLCDDLRLVYGMHTIEEDVGVSDWKWTVVPYQEPYYIGNTLFVHDQGGHGRTALQKLMKMYPTENVVMGHTHRAMIEYSNTKYGVRVGVNLGWLGDGQHAKYLAPGLRNDWVTGYTIIRTEDKGPADVHFHPIFSE